MHPAPLPNPAADFDAAHYQRGIKLTFDLSISVFEKFADDAIAPPPAQHPTPTAPEQAKTNLQHAQAAAHVTRIVRQCALVAQQLSRPLKPLAEAPPPDASQDPRVQILLDLDHAIRTALRHARDTGEDRPDAERLHREGMERLERLEGEGELTRRPVADLAAQLCAELGLPVPAEPRVALPPRKPGKANATPKTLSQMTDEELTIAELNGTLPAPTAKELAEYAAMEAYREERKHNPPVGCVGHWHPHPPPGWTDRK